MDTIEVKRKLGASEFITKRTRINLRKLRPNNDQPRHDWDLPDEELQRQIIANGGLWEPILVEPIPGTDEYQIVDGHRRWFNSKLLVENRKLTEFEIVPVEMINKPMQPIERITAWVFIHRQRREWPEMVKEGVAFNLTVLVGKAKAAELLGVTLKEIDELVTVYQYAKDKFSKMGDAAITWAREVLNMSTRWKTPQIEEAIVKKVNSNLLTNSRELRKLRLIAKDSQALAEFMKDEGTIQSAMNKLASREEPPKPRQDIAGDLGNLILSLRSYSWSAIQEVKRSPELINRLNEAEKLVKDLKDIIGLGISRRK
jgi:ParB family chromosome partitioning protein